MSSKFDLNLSAIKERKKFIVVMSDGIPAQTCGDCGTSCENSCDVVSGIQDCHLGMENCCFGSIDECSESFCDTAVQDSVCSVSNAKDEMNVTLYTIGIGPIVSVNCENALYTLKTMADVGGGKYCGSAEAEDIE